jgi:hypothetical protein
MHLHPAQHRAPDPEASLSALLVGIGLAACGLCFGLLAVTTPFASRIAGSPVPAGMPLDLVVWALAVVAATGLLIGGTQRLAVIVASIRHHAAGRSVVFRATNGRAADIDVTLGVVPGSGRPIPEVVSGAFGAAVVHELGRGEAIRQVGSTWETRSGEGWVPTERPIDRASRDAERIRHWLTDGDLDFVVKVYAAVVTPDGSMPRSPTCAVLTESQIPQWLAALPRQRSLSAARRDRLSNRLHGAASGRRGW